MNYSGPGLAFLRARPPIAILGVPFDHVTSAQALDQIRQMIASREPHYLVTPNVDFLVQARTDVELRRILCEADLVLCDGTPLLWISRFLGNPLPERVAGSDLAPLLISMAAMEKYRLFLLGASPASTARAVVNLYEKYPGLIIAGTYSPPFDHLLKMNLDDIKGRILQARPDLLLVAFGCPKQEKWIAMNYRTLGVPVTIGLGGTIDFLAGRLKRAPHWMQRTGTEWLYRLAQEPRRLFRRYLKDLLVFGWCILAQFWSFRLGRLTTQKPATENDIRTAPPPGKMQRDSIWDHLETPRTLDSTITHDEQFFARLLPGEGRHCLLHMDKVDFIDSTGMGLLIRLQQKVRAAGGQMVLVSPSPAVERALRVMRLEGFFCSAPDAAQANQVVQKRLREEQVLVALGKTEQTDTLFWRGEITAVNAGTVWEQTHAYLASSFMGRQAIIDLSSVRFIDSSALGVMVRARKFALEQGVQLLFTGLCPAVQNVVRLARLEDFLCATD